MLGKFNKFIYILLVGIFFFIAIDDVMAEKKIRQIMTTDERFYYYTTKNSKFGSYAGTSSSSDATLYTKYKYIGYVGNHAYCVQSESLAPSNGANYYEVNINETINAHGTSYGKWSEGDAYTSGCIIETIYDEAGDDNAAYVETYSALNSYLGFSSRIDFANYNDKIADYVKKGKECYVDMEPDDWFPTFSAKAVDPLLAVHSNSDGSTYYTGSFTLSGIKSEWGGDKVEYKIVLPSGVTLCTDSSCSKKNSTLTYDKAGIDKIGTFYFKVTGASVGQDIKIQIVGSNSSTYGYARLWVPDDVNAKTQLVVTYNRKTFDREDDTSVIFSVPDINTKTIKLVKKDATTGEFLKGANLTLNLSGGAGNRSCTITEDKYSCEIKIEEDVVSDTYYSVVENSAPNGYVKSGAISDTKWDLNENSSLCYVNVDGVLNVTAMEDCNRSYVLNDVCTNDSGASFSVGQCPVVEDTTGLQLDEATGLYYDQEGNLVENIPTKTVGENVRICYYLSGDKVEKVDDSKCSSQYTKVTNKSGNLVVEYYNTKNHVEISKYEINGEEELPGADLKICSDKPDEKGNCTIVRNTLDGQCQTVDVDDNGEEFSVITEFNCTNNDDNTKTVDMHWISGNTSKIWYGLSAGTYYIVETTAPVGYLPLSTYVEFTLDDDGNITSTAYNNDKKKIIIENKFTGFKVIKKDSSNGKNLAGALLSICPASLDENGNYQLFVGSDGYCVPAVLADGTSASWTSDDKAKNIVGLGVGAYYLLEIKAPENYTIANSILFMVKEDGTLSDKDGNVIENNELIMMDDPIVNQKTGELPILTIVLVGICAVAICGFSYYYLVKKNGFEIIKNKFKKN